MCRRCYGPHEESACKWTSGACYSCGIVGHKSSKCKNPTLKPVFCFTYKQRGHIAAQCKEKPRVKPSGRGSGNGKKGTARVFALTYEEAPSVDTFAGNMLVSGFDAYVLVDTGATHVCISEEFMSRCSLIPEVLADCIMHVGAPFNSESMLTKICRAVEVMIEDICMPIEMLVLLITDFDVVLGANWLNKYRVTIDCLNR